MEAMLSYMLIKKMTNKLHQNINLTGDYEGESKIEGKAKQNKEDKIEVNDADIVYIQNGLGEYCKCENVAGFSKVTMVVERSGQYIQNGVELRPNAYDNDFGLERRWARICLTIKMKIY